MLIQNDQDALNIYKRLGYVVTDESQMYAIML